MGVGTGGTGGLGFIAGCWVTSFQIPARPLLYAGSGKIMNLSATQFPLLYDEDTGGIYFLVWVRIRTEELCVH